jgi:thioredoxin 1
MEAIVATTTLTSANFDEVVSTSDLVLIDFWASWCGPCRAFAPVYERVSQRHGDVVFGKVDTEAEPGLAGAFGISAIPTLMIIRDNVILYAQPGALPEDALEELVTKASEADMDDVRRRIAESRSGTGAGQPA